MAQRILIADDDATQRYLLQNTLQRKGYDIIMAHNGSQAMEILDRPNSPRLAVIDWMMPKADGLAVCNHIKQTDNPVFTYLILLTSRNQPGDVSSGLEAGADDFLTKPVNPNELCSRVAVGFRTLDYEQRLKENEFQTRLECYRAISDLAEKRDVETGQHAKRIAAYCMLMAEQLGLDEQFVKSIGIFSPLHDIGKVGIPDNILRAPRKLTREEFDQMKTHTVIGHEILAGKNTLEMAADIALNHHERFDGSGYPNGLAGHDISIAGRIVAIADVYDALRSERPYKQPWSQKDTVQEMVCQNGKHFDPEIIDVFIKIADQFDDIVNTISEPLPCTS